MFNSSPISSHTTLSHHSPTSFSSPIHHNTSAGYGVATCFGPGAQNGNLPVLVSPSIWLGSFSTLNDSKFISDTNIQLIINCSPVQKFLKFFNDDANNVVLSSNIMILNLDPNFTTANLNQDEQFQLLEFNKVYNKVLQNYLNYFYKFNDNLNYLIHNTTNLSINSPILTGNLLNQYFNITRFINLCKNIDSSIQTLVISEHGTSQLSTSLLISLLMDNYNYNLENSFRHIKNLYPAIHEFNPNFYDDLLMIDNLKKFYHENKTIKLMNPPILTTNYKLKRRHHEETTTCRGTERKRKILYPRV